MWTSLMHPTLPVLELVFRAGIVYLAVLILLRISGKRQVGQMGPTEFVAILLISNAVQNAMNGGDNSLLGGLILAGVIIALSIAISILTYRSRRFMLIFEGTPRLLIHDGKPIQAALRKERLSLSELHTLLRKQGIHSFHEAKTAVLEGDGTLSVIRFSDLAPSSANLHS